MGAPGEHVCFKLTTVCASALRVSLSKGISVCDKPVYVWVSLCVLECLWPSGQVSV